MSIQDKITPVKPITVLIFLNIQESTGPVLSVQVRHDPRSTKMTAKEIIPIYVFHTIFTKIA